MDNPTARGDFVSVILPVHDGEKLLAETIASILSQSYENLEFIIVDDGFADRSHDIARAFASRDPCIQVHRQPNSGVAAARNMGIRLSTGEFIAPIDADDLWHPDKLAKQSDTFAASSEPLRVVYTASIYIDEASRGLSFCNWIDRPDDHVWLELFVHNFTCNASTPLFRAYCLSEHGGYDEFLFAAGAQGSEDWDICLRLANAIRSAMFPNFWWATASCRVPCRAIRTGWRHLTTSLYESSVSAAGRSKGDFAATRSAGLLSIWHGNPHGVATSGKSSSGALSLLGDPLSILDNNLRYTVQGGLRRKMTGEEWPRLKAISGDTDVWLEYASTRPGLQEAND